MELCWSYNQVQKSSYFESLLVTRLWEIKLTSPLPSIQSCSFKFWAWSCILATLIKGGGGDHKYKIMGTGSVKSKYYSVASIFATGYGSLDTTSNTSNTQLSQFDVFLLMPVM